MLNLWFTKFVAIWLMICSGSSRRGSEGAHGFLRRRKQGTGVHSAGRRSPVPLPQRRHEVRPWSSCRYHWRDVDRHLRSSGRHGTSGAHQGDRYTGIQSPGRCCEGQLNLLRILYFCELNVESSRFQRKTQKKKKKTEHSLGILSLYSLDYLCMKEGSLFCFVF